MSGDIKVLFDDKMNAIQAGTVQVFHFDMTTREFMGTEEIYIHVGVGLPAASCLDEPPVQDEYQVAVRSEDNSSWSITDDYRGITVYDVQTLASHVITEPGPIPDTVTTSAPSTPYDNWDGSAWITDSHAQHIADIAVADAQKKELITQISVEISILEDAVALEMATDEEKKRLKSLKAHRVLISRIDTALAPNIIFPDITTGFGDE